MKHDRIYRVLGMLILAISFIHPAAAAGQDASPEATPVPGVDIIANGLTNPRGLTWAPDGSLYLAQAGSGGSTRVGSTQFYGGETSSIVAVADGCTTPVAEGFPSTYWQQRKWVWGVMDIAFLDGELYALHSGGEQGWHFPETPNGIYRVKDDGTWVLVADLASWFKTNFPKNPPDDFDRNGSLFDMEAGDGRLWVTESNGGRLLTVTPDGAITLVADLSAQERTPTGLALDGKGGAYIGYLTVISYQNGTSKVVHVDAKGVVSDQWTGLTAVNDVVLGPDGTLYAVEMGTGNPEESPFINPDSGQIVHQTGPDSSETVATDIPYPVMMGFRDDGTLYVAGPAFGPDRNEGRGWLVRVVPGESPVSLAGIGDAPPTCAGQTSAGRAA